jgi:hypothetical protein
LREPAGKVKAQMGRRRAEAVISGR